MDILEHPLGPYSEDPFAGGRIANPNAFHVVDSVALSGVGHGFAIEKGVAPEDAAIGRDHL